MAYTYETFNGIHGCPEIGNLTATLSHFFMGNMIYKPFALGGPRDPGSLFGKRLPYVTLWYSDMAIGNLLQMGVFMEFTSPWLIIEGQLFIIAPLFIITSPNGVCLLWMPQQAMPGVGD